MAPTIDIFTTTILSNPAMRGRHERTRRAMTAARVEYSEHDVASDEAAKSMWKRKNKGTNELPFILVDGEPVGTIEELDEAVEFGELRQFLRLDTPSASTSTPAPSSNTTSDARRPLLDDFADLDLSPAELAQLQSELAKGDSFSSGLVDASPSSKLDFSTATQRFTPSFSPTAPLKLAKVNFERALPDRPLASDVVKDDLEGIDAEELDEDELQKLMDELEGDENERRRLRDAQPKGDGVQPPPLPEKTDEEGKAGGAAEPALPKKEDGPSDDVADATSVEGAGGAALSAPLAEVEKLRLDDSTLNSLHSSSIPSSLSVSSPSTSSPLPLSAALPDTPPRPSSTRTSPKEAAKLKSELYKAAEGSDDADPQALKDAGGSMALSEVPSFGVSAMEEGAERETADADEGKKVVGIEPVVEEPVAEESTDGLADRVAEAIRGGDL